MGQFSLSSSLYSILQERKGIFIMLKRGLSLGSVVDRRPTSCQNEEEALLLSSPLLPPSSPPPVFYEWLSAVKQLGTTTYTIRHRSAVRPARLALLRLAPAILIRAMHHTCSIGEWRRRRRRRRRRKLYVGGWRAELSSKHQDWQIERDKSHRQVAQSWTCIRC